MSTFDVTDIGLDLLKLSGAEFIEILEYFTNLKANYAKVNFVEQLLVKHKLIEKILFKCTLRVEKCNKTSLEYRKLGNEQFSPKNRNYFQALELYNKSICFSEPNTENLAISYANRSAVFFQLKRYRECLANIKLAREANFPTFLMHKLDKREKDCLQLLASQPPDIKPYDFKMSFAPHPLVPNIAECLELVETPEQGRFICTTRDLAVGDLVATEKPFCATLQAPMRYIRCATCKVENSLTLIPCEKCCSTMFCSEGCREQAMNTFHKYECPIIDLLYTMFDDSHDALQVCLSTIEFFPTIEELIAFCNNPENKKKSAFDLNYTNFTPREHYRAIHGMVTNQSKRCEVELFKFSVLSAVLMHFVIGYTPLKEFLDHQEGRNFFTELLFQHLQSSKTNMHGMELIKQIDETKNDRTHSTGAFAFFSLLNHSCAPNTIRVFKNTTVYLFVLRPIPAGGVLYDNYGPWFPLFSKAQRNELLSNAYHFTCKCEACVKEYPVFPYLPSKPYILKENIECNYKIRVNYDYEFALKNYGKYCKVLTQYATAYPCQEISQVEHRLRMLFHILVDAVPFKAKIEQKNA